MLTSVRIKHFKAVRDSGEIKLTPLTAFIGNNGSGKSSIIEALETYQDIVLHGLDKAMQVWRGFEYIVNPPIELLTRSNQKKKINPIELSLTGNVLDRSFRTNIKINANVDRVFIEGESLNVRGKRLLARDDNDNVTSPQVDPLRLDKIHPDLSLISPAFLMANYRSVHISEGRMDMLAIGAGFPAWQFLRLNPIGMGQPRTQTRTSGEIKLASDGSNIAEYLLDIRNQDANVFEGILETLQYVLPYARDLQPTLTSELERAVYLQMTEGTFKVPGWLLSTGTLRVLALLAVLRHPKPPPLIVIEELENGLDPRTIHLIVEEIRNFIEADLGQVIITTHSPYLLDLLALSHIVLVERNADHEPVFSRPADQASLQSWAKDFGPGKLYTMSKLSREDQP